jgi:hypothetical protein
VKVSSLFIVFIPMLCKATFIVQLCSLLLTTALQVPDISQCPNLALRNSPASSAYDLRPDDFTMIMALGDRLDNNTFVTTKNVPCSLASYCSVTAGFGIEGIQGQFVSSNSLEEYRGQSFSIGGVCAFSAQWN